MLEEVTMKKNCKCNIKSNLSLSNEYGMYSVAVKCSDLTADEFVHDLVRPLMLAAGYAENNINEVLNDVQ
jgi:hypothetical protein